MNTYKEFCAEFRAFCVDYDKWVKEGAHWNRPFSRSYGLCLNFIRCWNKFSDNEEYYFWIDWSKHLFTDEYPFGKDDYKEREECATMHECPKRMAFVRGVVDGTINLEEMGNAA